MSVVTGNAAQDGIPNRGWLLGHFVEDGDPRRTTALEVKWGVHANGERRAAWGTSTSATTLSLLVRGRIRIQFEDGAEALLAESGDYALWAPGVAHRWRIEAADTVVLTVRWPSLKGDATDASEEPNP